MSQGALFDDSQPAKSHINPVALPLVAVCAKCGPTEHVDAPIHDGNSVRRDCARCGWTLGFPIWHGEQVEVSR